MGWSGASFYSLVVEIDYAGKRSVVYPQTYLLGAGESIPLRCALAFLRSAKIEMRDARDSMGIRLYGEGPSQRFDHPFAQSNNLPAPTRRRS